MTLKRKGTFLTKQRIMINSIETVCILLLLIVVILYITEGYHIVLCIGNLSPKKFCAICARFKWGLSKGNPTHAFFKETGEVLWVSEICRTDISHFLFCLPVCLSPWRSCSKCCLTFGITSRCLSVSTSLLYLDVVVKGDPEHKVSFGAKNVDNTMLSHS